MKLQQLYSSSKTWRSDFLQNPAAACTKKGGASLCAADSTETTNSYAQLLMATSPQAYNSTTYYPAQVGSVRLVAAAGDQRSCQSCTAFAVAAAAETAMAAVLGVPVEDCSISVQGLFFCPPNGMMSRNCAAGWTLIEALQQLEQHSSSIPTADCLPYRPDIRNEWSMTALRKSLCEGACSFVNDYASQGSFGWRPITSIWDAQQHIRQYGSVVTRFDVNSGEPAVRGYLLPATDNQISILVICCQQPCHCKLIPSSRSLCSTAVQ